MAIHENIKPSDQELPLLLAGKALTGARSLASRPTGTISVENPDGTSTIIGAGGDGPDGIAQQVGKTSQPGTPTGLGVSATGLTVSLTWDGTSDGIEENAGLTATLTDESGTSIRMGETPGAGTLVATATVPGLAHVTARTYDNAHDTDGNPSRNLSQPATLDIVLSEIVDSQAIDDQMRQVNRTLDDNRQALDQANTDLADARKRLDEHDRTIAQSRTDIADADRRLTSHDQVLKDANTELQNASKLIDDNRSQLAQTNASLKSAQADVSKALQNAQTAQSTADSATSAAGEAKKTAQDAVDSAATALSAADNASNTAGEAKTAADSASKTAGEAKTAAGKAQSTADNAASNASAALVNANSALAKAKNITFQKTAPSDPAKGDVWYPLDDSGHAIGMRTWDGVNWGDVTLVAGKLIVPGSIGSTLIADGAVTAPKITAGAVTADKLAANSVDASKLTANAVTADKLAANSVTADKLAAGSVDAGKLTADSVTSASIVSGAVTADKLAANSVTADKLAANSVTADKLGANSVTADKIAAEAITGDKIAANSISTSKLTISAGNLFSNPTFAGDASSYGTTDRVDTVTFPDGSTGSTVAMKMDVTGMNPNVSDSEWIPCNRGDVFYVGVWLSYADDTPSVPQGRTLHLGLDTRGDSSESWPNNGAQGLNIDTSEIPRNDSSGDKWKYFHTYATCTATGVTRFWIDVLSNSNGFHLLVWRPTVIRAADAKLIVNGSITADKIQGNRLIGTEIQTSDKPPYMLLRNQHTQATSDLSVETDQGQLSLVGEDESDLGGINFLHMDSVTGPNARNDYMLSIAVVDPGRADDSEHGNEIRLVDADTSGMGRAGGTAADDRSISLISRQTSVCANSGGTHREYDFTPEGLYAPDVGDYMAHGKLFSRSDADAQGKNGEVKLPDGHRFDDWDILDIQYVTDSQQVHGSQRFYRPESGTWVGFKFCLSLNYAGAYSWMYLNSAMYQILSQTELNTLHLGGGSYATGQLRGDGSRYTQKDIMWITRIDGWRA